MKTSDKKEVMRIWDDPNIKMVSNGKITNDTLNDYCRKNRKEKELVALKNLYLHVN